MFTKIRLNSIKKFDKHIAAGILLFSFAAGAAIAATKADIKFPVKELGGCANEKACRSYCDNPKNIRPCVDFAEKYNLMGREEAAKARKFVDLGAKGPGNCSSDKACKKYCDDISHIDECVGFAEKHGMISQKELAEARKVQEALRKGAKLPGGCSSKDSCESYCESGEHIEECVAFAEAAGFMDADELAEAKQALTAVKKGVKLPKCRGREACDKYCSEPEHLEECLSFAEAAGFMSPEEVMMVRKVGGKGPGGCRGKAECDVFCEQPENRETCFNFAKEHDLLTEEDKERIEEGRERITEALEDAPDEVRACVDAGVGKEKLENMISGKEMPNPNVGDVIQHCFEKEFGNQYREDSGYDDEGDGGDGAMMGGQEGERSAGPGSGPIPPIIEDCMRDKLGDELFEGIQARRAFPPAGFEQMIQRCVQATGPSALSKFLTAALGLLVPGLK